MFDSKENKHLYFKMQQGREIWLLRLERYVCMYKCMRKGVDQCNHIS